MKKYRVLALILALFMALEMMYVPSTNYVMAETVYIPDDMPYGFSLNDDYTATLTGYYADKNQEGSDISIPDSVEYEGTSYTITEIGGNAFAAANDITGVTAPSVTSIGDGAFMNCSSLMYAYFDTAESVGASSFEGCLSLASISISDDCIIIGDGAFRNCSALETITLPSSLESIGDGAFYNDNITMESLPDGLDSIGDNAFMNCPNINVAIPDSVSSIGAQAFYNDYSMQYPLIMSDSLEYVGDEAFNNTSITEITPNAYGLQRCVGNFAKDVTTVNLQAGILTIPANEFSGCDSLTSVTIPNTVQSIGGYAFYNCSSLTSLSIPTTCTSVGNNAFDGTSLSQISLGKQVTTVGTNIVSGDTHIKCYKYSEAYKAAINGGLKYTLENETLTNTNTTITITKTPVFTGTAAIAGISVTYDNHELTVNDDYTVICSNNEEVGVDNATVTITGAGCYLGNASKQYSVNIDKAVDFAADKIYANKIDLKWKAVPDADEYEIYRSTDGTEFSYLSKTSAISYTDSGLTADTKYCYKIKAVKNTQAQTIKGEFTDVLSLKTKKLQQINVSAEFRKYYDDDNFNLNAVAPNSNAVKCTYISDDQDVVTVDSAGNVTIVGEGTATITIKAFSDDQYDTAEVTVSVIITKKTLEDAQITLDYENAYFEGEELTPEVTVSYGDNELILDTDYSVQYIANDLPGTATAKVTGKGIYTGVVNKYYSIKLNVPQNVKASTDSASKAGIIWNKVIGATEYQVYISNTPDGEYSLAGTSADVYTGVTDDGLESYYYVDSNLQEATTYYYKVKAVYKPASGVPMSGELSEPAPVTTKRTQTITGPRTYTKYTDAGEFVLQLSAPNSNKYQFAFSSQTPDIATINSLGKVTIKGEGDAKLTVIALPDDTYESSIITVVVHVISKKEIHKCSSSISSLKNVYTGKVITPGITMKDGKTTLKKGTDYTVSYADNVKIGKASVTITGIGRYQGKLTLYYTIIAAPSKVKNLKVSSYGTDRINITWNRAASVNGYKVYRYDSKLKRYVLYRTTTANSCTITKLATGSKHYFRVYSYINLNGKTYLSSAAATSGRTKPAKVSSLKLVSGNNRLTVKWKKTACSGYEIKYSTSSKFSSKTTKTVRVSSKYSSRLLKSLKNKRNYYVKIRAYVIIDGKRVYGSYTGYKRVKTK